MMTRTPWISIDYHCDKLNDGTDMTFKDTVIINEYTFVMGHPTHSDDSDHNGVAIYRPTWDDDEEEDSPQYLCLVF